MTEDRHRRLSGGAVARPHGSAAASSAALKPPLADVGSRAVFELPET